MYHNPIFDLAQIQTANGHLYLGALSRSNEGKGRISGRDAVVSVESGSIYNYDKAENISRNSALPAENNSRRYTTHDNGNKDLKKKAPEAKAGYWGGGCAA